MTRATKTIALLAITAALAAPAASQRTWVVDSRGGGDFTDLPPAVTAASAGDTILVRSSLARATTIRKGLRLLGETQGTNQLGPMGTLVVEGIPADQQFVLAGFGTIAGWEPQLALEFRNCAGSVKVGEVRMPADGDTIQTRAYAIVHDCADVTFQGCWLLDLNVRRSRVAMTWCRLAGAAWPRNTSFFGYPGLDCEDSDITLAQCGVSGGVSFLPAALPGIRMLRGRLRIAASDDISTFFVINSGMSWDDAQQRSVAGPVIHSDGGLVEIDPEVRLISRATGPITTGTSTFVRRVIPFLRGRTTNPSNVRQTENLDVHLHAPAGASGWVFVAAPTHPVLFPGLGDVWLDPGSIFTYGTGTVPTTGPLSFSHNVGDNVFPAGTVFALQAVVLHQGQFELTPPFHPILTALRLR